MIKHLAIYITNNDDKPKLIELIVTGNILKLGNHLKPAIFSELTLNAFIDEEIPPKICLLRHKNWGLTISFFFSFPLLLSSSLIFMTSLKDFLRLQSVISICLSVCLSVQNLLTNVKYYIFCSSLNFLQRFLI